MAVAKSLIDVIDEQDAETVRKLVVPWQKETFPHPSVLKEDGSYFNMRNYGNYIHAGDYLSDEQPGLGKVIFDLLGEFQYKLPDESGEKGLVNLLIGIVPPQSVWENMKGHPIPDKGSDFVLPRQFIYLTMFGPDFLLAVVPQMSGRMPDKPIIYYTVPTRDGKDAIGLLLPYKLMVEIPRIVEVPEIVTQRPS